MSYSLYDPTEEYITPKFWIAKPNKQILTRVKELEGSVAIKVELGGITEVTGSIPYLLNRGGVNVRNPHIDLLKNKYLLKMEFMNKVEWLVIENVNKAASDEKDAKSFTAYSIAYNLRGKKMYNDKFEGVTIGEAMTDLLKYTSWSLGKVSAEIGGKVRTFDEFSPNTTVLEVISTMCESYDAIPEYDTEKKLINLLHKNDYGVVSNLMLNDKNYIESYDKSNDSNEIVTRLYAMGDEGLTFKAISPTGTNYIEKFDWYMHPFNRDKNKNTISSSDYMSDALCHAILDQQEAIVNITPQVNQIVDEIAELEDGIFTLYDAEDEKRLNYEIVEGILDIMKANNEYEFSDFSLSNSYNFKFRKGWYLLQARSKSSNGSIKIGTDTHELTATWKTIKYDKTFLDELGDGESVTVTKVNGNVEFYLVRVPQEEYTTFTDLQIKEKYSISFAKDEWEHAKNNNKSKAEMIEELQQQLDDLRLSVGDDKFYTQALLTEKAEYIYEEYWEETTHTDEKELYTDAVEKIKELHKPKLEISTNIYNFLESLDDKRNWNKLILGSKVLVKHSRIDEFNEVILSSINYNIEGEGIDLTLTDAKNLSDTDFRDLIMQGAKASSTLTLNKHLYDDAVQKSLKFDEIINSAWDATKRRILAGVNESVSISSRGIEVVNPDHPTNKLILNSGVLAISNDGGQTFKNAITTEGIVAEKIVGKMMIGENLILRSDDGTNTNTGNLQTIKDRNGNTKVQIGEYSPNKFGVKVYDGAFELVGGISENELSPSLTNIISNAVTKGEDVNGVKIDTVDGLTITSNYNKLTLNASKGLELTRKSDNKQLLYLDGSGGAVFGGELKAATGTFSGNINMTGGSISWSSINAPTASQVGARPSNWIPSEYDVLGSKTTYLSSNGLYTGTIEAEKITGTTITGLNFKTIDRSDSGKIEIEGSTLTSTKYGTSGSNIEYTKMENGILSIRSKSGATGSFQTVSIDGNYGLNISSDINSNSQLRMDVYETGSSKWNIIYKIEAERWDAAIDTTLEITATKLLNLKASSVTLNGNSIATQSWVDGKSFLTSSALNSYWRSGSTTGYLSSGVYIGANSIGVGGSFNGSASTSNVSLGSSNIYAPGTIYAGGSSLTSSRDKKKQIVTFNESVLDDVMKMRPVNYLLNQDNDNELPRLGFILEELNLVSLVSPDGGVDQYALSTVAIKAIQELTEKVKLLESQLGIN